MKHTFDGYEWNGDDNVPAQFTVDIPERIYLQIVEDDGTDMSETTILADESDRTFCGDRINQTDVEYVHHVLYAAAIACAEAAEAELESALAVVDLYQTRAMAAEAEVAALRADLAALRARLTEYDEEWRPCPDATDDEAVTT